MDFAQKLSVIGDKAVEAAVNLILQIVTVRVDSIEEIRDQGKILSERKLKQHI